MPPAARGREVPELPKSTIIPEEWVLVRRSQCLPGRCPRLAGDPPEPPRDRHCEVCASAFLEQYWDHLLHGPDYPMEEPPRRPRVSARECHGDGPLIVLPGQRPLQARFLWPTDAPRERRANHWRPVLIAVGLSATIAGAVLAGLTPWAVPGIIALVAGIVCLVVTAAAAQGR